MDREDFEELKALLSAAAPEIGDRVYRAEDLNRSSYVDLVQSNQLVFPLCVVAVAGAELAEEGPMDCDVWRIDVRVGFVASIDEADARTDPDDPTTADPQGYVAAGAKRIANALRQHRGPRLWGQRCGAAPNIGPASEQNAMLQKLLDGRVASTVGSRMLTGTIPDWKVIG